MSKLSNVKHYGLSEKLLVDIMEVLKKQNSVTFSVDERNLDVYMVIFNHVKWLHKHNCLVLSKSLYADDRLWCFSFGQPDFEEFYNVSKDDFNVIKYYNKIMNTVTNTVTFINLCNVAREIVNRMYYC